METAWTGFLHGSGPAGHAVQVYLDIDELADSVSRYLAIGLDVGEPGVVIATPEHWSRFGERLAESGWDAARIERSGLLFCADAETTLAAIMDGDRPSADQFDAVVGGLLDGVSAQFPQRRIRAFGEMVDLLCERGNPTGATRLEELWNRLARRRSFSLLCGYRIDVFDLERRSRSCRRSAAPIRMCFPPTILRASSGPSTPRSRRRSGHRRARSMRSRRQLRRKQVPPAQLALMWVSSQMPRSAEQILESARAHYLQEPAAQPTV